MKTLILVVSLLGLFMDSAFASNAIQLINKDKQGSTVYQTVNINHNTNVAAFSVYSGTYSTNAVVDYNNGIIIYQMPYKRICIVSRMNKETFPNISQLENMIHEGQPVNPLQRSYGISRRRVTNMGQLGGPIQAICGGMTTYWATEFQKSRFSRGGRFCVQVNLLILNVNLCGGFLSSKQDLKLTDGQWERILSTLKWWLSHEYSNAGTPTSSSLMG